MGPGGGTADTAALKAAAARRAGSSPAPGTLSIPSARSATSQPGAIPCYPSSGLHMRRRNVRSSNPVLTHLGPAAGQQGAGNTYNQAPPGQNPFQYGQYGQQQYPQQQGYGYPPAPPAVTGQMMSLDDVIVRTVMLLALTGIAGALAWVLVPATGAVASLAMFGSMIA